MRYLTALFCLLLVGSLAFALADPSMAYCDKMGYKSTITKTSAGETGICIVNGTSYDSWAFFQGKVGQQYSYCTKKGYDTKTQISPAPYSIPYAVCVPKKGTVKSASTTSNITMLDLMINNRDGILGSKVSSMSVLGGATPSGVKAASISSSGALPSSFDWRNVNGSNWMTPVKNQGSWPNCFYFASAAVVEAKFNIDNKNPKLLYDLSEQDLHTCSNSTWTFQYMKDSGVVDEACDPYAPAITTCNRCPDWKNRTAKIRDYYSVTGGPEALKRALMQYGPILIAIDAYDIGMPPNSWHSVALIGWNDTGGYWIIKNSWGAGWGGNGYGKLPYNRSLEQQTGSAGYVVGQTIHPLQPHYVPEFGPLGAFVVIAGGLIIVFWRSRA